MNNTDARLNDKGFLNLGPTPEEVKARCLLERINTALFALAVAGLWAMIALIAANA